MECMFRLIWNLRIQIWLAEFQEKLFLVKIKIYKFNNDSTIETIEINIRSSDDISYYVDNLKDSTFFVAQPLLNAKDGVKITPVFQ